MQYVLGGFALFIVLVAVSRLVAGRRRAPHLQQSRGTVVAKRFTGRSGTGNEMAFAHYQLDVQFSTQGGQQVAGTARGQYRAQVARDPGEPIDVWYVRGEPVDFQLVPPGSLRQDWQLVLVLVLVAAVALAVVLL